MNRAQRVRAARAAILGEAIAFVNDGNDADAVESNRVEITHTRYEDGRVEWAVRGPGCGTSRWELGTTAEALASLRTALSIIDTSRWPEEP